MDSFQSYLSNTPWQEKSGLLRVRQHALSCVETAEVGGSVDDDALDWHSEPSVHAYQTVALEDLAQAIAETLELSRSSGLADIGG